MTSEPNASVEGKSRRLPVVDLLLPQLSEEQTERFGAIIANTPRAPDIETLRAGAPDLMAGRKGASSVIPSSKRIAGITQPLDMLANAAPGLGALHAKDAEVRQRALAAVVYRGRRPSARRMIGIGVPGLTDAEAQDSLDFPVGLGRKEKLAPGAAGGGRALPGNQPRKGAGPRRAEREDRD